MAAKKDNNLTNQPEREHKGDLSDLEGKVLNEEEGLTRAAATHEDVLAAVEMEKREHDVEHLVQTRGKDRPVVQGIPVPQVGVYIVVPPSLWPAHYDIEDHRGHGQQVVQTRSYSDDGLSTVTIRCDCAAEFTFTWTDEAATAVTHPTDDDIEALRSVPEGFEEPAPRSDLDRA